MSLGLHHLAVVTADLARSEAFYAGVLGLPVIRRHDDAEGRPRAVWLALDGGVFLALERAGRDAPRRDPEAPGWHCVALGIPRADRGLWRARLEAAGFPVVRETAFTMYAHDPDGCLVGLSHYPEPVDAG
jgi:catechol 2,3-dioxygenase-like lactoylglutathione lyase family enzyme